MFDPRTAPELTLSAVAVPDGGDGPPRAREARDQSEFRIAGQMAALEMAVSGAPLDDVLDRLVRTAQELAGDGARAMLFRVDADAAQLRPAAAAGMTEEYARQVDGIIIDPATPLCGTAAYSGEAVIVRDVAADPLWVPYLALAREHRIGACWSFPVRSLGRTVATLAVYHHAPRDPLPAEMESMELLTRTAALILERHQDAEERRRVEEALRESEARYRALSDLSPDATWVNQDGSLVYANHAAARLIGARDPDDLLGRAALDFVIPEHQPRVRERIERLLASRETSPLAELRWQRLDGSLVDVESSAAAITWQGRPAIQVIFRDITERKRAEAERERLIEAERAARSEAERAAEVTSLVTTHLAEGICLMDAGGRLTYMNPAAERILGWTQAELEGKVLHDQVHYKRPDGRPFPIQECELGQVLSAARPVVGFVDWWIRKDGSFVPLVTSCAPLLSGGGVAGAVLSMHDDTERRRAEAERERLLDAEHAARGEAEAANRAKTEFLAVMSHELRTPLNAIGGYAELLEMGIHGPVTEPQRTALGRIQQSQRHLLGLINEVLNYAKLETGAVRYDLADVRVQDVLGTVAALVEPQARARDLALSIHSIAPVLLVRADEEKLRQILVNLLGNAIKFTDRGGRVEVACRGGGGKVHLAVRDTGIGIPADKLETIFEPFVQVRSDLTRTAEGTGLGLAISRDLARGMDGDLAVESTPGQGSTFTLTLPAPQSVPA